MKKPKEAHDNELVMDLKANAMTLDTRDGKTLAVSLAGKNVRLKASDDNIIILLHSEEAAALAKALRHYAAKAAKP